MLGNGVLLLLIFFYFSCRKVMEKRGNLYFLFSLPTQWCSYFTGSHLQSTGEMLVFRSYKKIKHEQLHSSTLGTFYENFPLQRPSFVLLGPELLMTFKGHFGERSKLLASRWTNDLHHVLMSPSQKCWFLLPPSAMVVSRCLSTFSAPHTCP